MELSGLLTRLRHPLPLSRIRICERVFIAFWCRYLCHTGRCHIQVHTGQGWGGVKCDGGRGIQQRNVIWRLKRAKRKQKDARETGRRQSAKSVTPIYPGERPDVKHYCWYFKTLPRSTPVPALILNMLKLRKQGWPLAIHPKIIAKYIGAAASLIGCRNSGICYITLSQFSLSKMFGGHLGLFLKNSHSIGFVIPKIVEFVILCITITCLHPKLSYFMFFKMGWAAILDLGFRMCQSRKITISLVLPAQK